MSRSSGHFSLCTCLLLCGVLIGAGGTVAADPSGVTESTDSHLDCSVTPSGSLGVAPAIAGQGSPPQEQVQYTNQNLHVARGDWAVLRINDFYAEGCERGAGPLPGEGLIYASPGTAKANASHTVALQVDKTVSGLQSVSVSYTPASRRPSFESVLLPSDVEVAGVDTTGDGIADQSLRDNLTYVSAPAAGTLQFGFDGGTTVPSGSHLLIRYDGINNPNVTGSAAVTVTASGNRSVSEQGTIEYTRASSGLLGHGIGYQLEPNTDSVSSLVTLRPLDVGNDGDALVIFLPTSGLPSGSMYDTTVVNALSERQNVSRESVAMGVNTIRVFSRSAIVFSNARSEGRQVTVDGYSVLAPGSQLRVRMITDNRLVEATTVVDRFRFWQATFSFPEKRSRPEEVRVTVYNQDDQLANETVPINR